MAITRCKFVLEEVTLGRAGTPTRMKFSAVYPQADIDGFKHDEDHAFWNATPFGTLEIAVQNPHAAELFQAGESYYLDISSAAKPEAVEA